MNFLDALDIFKEQFKSGKDLDHRGRIQGPIAKNTITAINNAIDGKYNLSFFYRGDKENAAGWRKVQPYVYGLVKGTGNQVVRAYWLTGKSVSRHYPKWRLYRLDRIINIAAATTETFKKPKPLYNYFWDKSMSMRFNWVKFPKALRK